MTAQMLAMPHPRLGSALLYCIQGIAWAPFVVLLLPMFFIFLLFAWALPMLIGIFTSDLREASPMATALLTRKLPGALLLLAPAFLLAIILNVCVVLEFVYVPFAHLAVVIGATVCRCCRWPAVHDEELIRTVIVPGNDEPPRREESIGRTEAPPSAPGPSEDLLQRAKALERYTAHEPVWEALQQGHEYHSERGEGPTRFAPDVRLLRLSWLMELATPGTAVHRAHGGVLGRRQDLPEEAFISCRELRQITSEAKSSWYAAPFSPRLSR